MTDKIFFYLTLFLLGTVCKVKAQSCGGYYYYYGNYGVLQSPNYPYAYNSYCYCTYMISLSTTSSILLTFETFELDRYSSTGDSVTISCVSNSSFNQVTYYWNSVATPISIPWCSYAQISFRSDWYNSFSVRGFRILYQVSTVDCGKTVYTGTSGNITSPNFPQSYNNNENCTHLIWASQPSSISLNFESFNLEWGTSTCSLDWVQIICDSTNYTLPKYCGSTLPSPVVIENCNQVLVWFHADHAAPSSGFSLQYFVTPNGCGQTNYTGTSGMITSPNYPQRFRNITCFYYLFPLGQVTFTFVSFDLEPFVDNTNGDYVQITCVGNPLYDTQTFRGNTLPSPITFTSCSLVRIYFYGNNVPYGTGFQLQYRVNISVANGGITEKPRNVAAYVGTRVQLNCTSNITGYLPSWTLSKDGTDENVTVIASFCDINSGYRSRYSVISVGRGVCNLVIRNATLAQAGVYTCTDVSQAFFSSIVSVIEVVPSVVKQPEVVKGDILSFQYFVKYASSVIPAPTPPMIFQWNSTGKTVVSSVIRPDVVNSSLNVTAEPQIVPSYGFTLKFSAPVNSTNFAANAPTFVYSRYSTSYTVLYWPEASNMTITGDINGYIAYNGLLRCNVSSNPPSRYRWLDQTSGISTNGSTVYVTHSGTYTCNASNVIRRKTYSSSKAITVNVFSQTTTPAEPVSSARILFTTTPKLPVSSPTTTSITDGSTEHVSETRMTTIARIRTDPDFGTTLKTISNTRCWNDSAVIAPIVLLLICVIGYIVLAIYCFIQRSRVKSNSSQKDNQLCSENISINETKSSNAYTNRLAENADVCENIPT